MADPDRRDGPLVIDLADAPAPDPGAAPALPAQEEGAAPRGAAMETVAAIGARPSSPLGRVFWWAAGALFTFVLSVAAWDFAAGLMARSPLVGTVAIALLSLFVAALLAMALREVAGIARLRRLDEVRRAAETAHAEQSLEGARAVVGRLGKLYAERPDTSWGMRRVTEAQGEVFDADALLGLVESEVLAPLDTQAQREIEAAARQVATVTAIVPLALADVVTALAANLRMIRRIAEIYGGRAGTLGNWRLMRSVMTHLVATGAVAVGDDMIQSIAGGGLLGRLSRRFGEGVVNGALTARVGVAALDVCRPLPFRATPRPSVTGTVQRALAGLFGSQSDAPEQKD